MLKNNKIQNDTLVCRRLYAHILIYIHKTENGQILFLPSIAFISCFEVSHLLCVRNFSQIMKYTYKWYAHLRLRIINSRKKIYSYDLSTFCSRFFECNLSSSYRRTCGRMYRANHEKIPGGPSAPEVLCVCDETTLYNFIMG